MSDVTSDAGAGKGNDAGAGSGGAADTGKQAAGGAADAGNGGSQGGADGGGKGMPAGFEGGAEAWAKLDDAGRQAALAKGADDGKSDNGKKGDDTGKKADGEGAPVDYAKAIAEVELPEGMKIDDAAVASAVEIFGKHKLPAEVVKDLVSLYAQQTKAGADGNAKAFSDQVSGWKASAEKDTTPEERGVAKEAALKVFGKDEVALLELFGVTNRGGFIKAMAKIGKMAIGDDTFVPGNAGGGDSRDARSQFPNSNMNP